MCIGRIMGIGRCVLGEKGLEYNGWREHHKCQHQDYLWRTKINNRHQDLPNRHTKIFWIWLLPITVTLSLHSTRGRKCIYPLGTGMNNVLGTLFTSKLCHNHGTIPWCIVVLWQHKIFYVTLHPGRKQMYPLGSGVNNVPRMLFISQSCQNYDSTPGTPLFCVVTPLFSHSSFTFLFPRK